MTFFLFFNRGNMSYRGPPPAPMRSSTIVSVPKPSQMNLAVMQQVQQGNKMTVLQAQPGTQKIITTGPATSMQSQVTLCFYFFFGLKVKTSPLPKTKAKWFLNCCS